MLQRQRSAALVLSKIFIIMAFGFAIICTLIALQGMKEVCAINCGRGTCYDETAEYARCQGQTCAWIAQDSYSVCRAPYDFDCIKQWDPTAADLLIWDATGDDCPNNCEKQGDPDVVDGRWTCLAG